MGFVRDLLRLLRPLQWYKNLVIFITVVFSTLIFNEHLLWLTFLGFVALCLASSGNYVVNDILDREADRRHPEKKGRPIASGAISVGAGIAIAAILFLVSFLIAYQFVSAAFLGLVLIFVLFTQLYSLFLKHIAFVDILMISVNFVLRAVGGIIILNRPTTPWLIVCPFFLALFLAVGKRSGDLRLLGKDATGHKKVLSAYTPQLTQSLLIISTTLLIISYTLYAFLNNEHQYLLIPSLPFALYLIFYYFSLLGSDSSIPRHPEQAITDPKMVIGILLWGIVTLAAIYFPTLFSVLR